MKHPVALGASSLLLAALFSIAGCEGDDGTGSPTATFDAGGFDGGGGSGGTTGDGATVDAGRDSGEGGVTPPPPTPNDVYVDPMNGLDANTGKSGSPFKSLTKAFSVVPANAGVHLLDGTYDAANESGSTVVTIPADVNVRSENPLQAKIDGLIVKTTGGNTALYDLVFVALTQVNVVGATKLLGVGLSFLPNGDAAISATDSADVTLLGGTLDGQGTGTPLGGGALFLLKGTGTLTLDGTVMKNTKAPGIRVDGPSLATKAKMIVKNAVFDAAGASPNAGTCTARAAIIGGSNASVVIDKTSVSNAGTALCILEGVDVTVQNGSTFTSNGAAVVAQDFIVTDNSSITIRGSMFTNNASGITWAAAGKVDVADSTFTAVTIPGLVTEAIKVFGGAPSTTVLVRKTTIHGAGYGVHLFTGGGTFNADLGTAGNAGNNDFSGNTVNNLRDELPAGTALDAQGNTWTASVQNADASGHFAAGTVVSGPQAVGTNFYISAAGTLNL